MDFIFTEHSFMPDSDELFGYGDLYSYAFKAAPKDESITFQYLKSIADCFLSHLLQTAGLELKRDALSLDYDEQELKTTASKAPPAIGTEYVNKDWVREQLDALLEEYRKEIKAFPGTVDLYLNGKDNTLCLPSRIYFHLVENRSGKYPFSFMATYTTKDESGTVRHYPLQYAKTEYKDDNEKFSELLLPISKASRTSKLAGELMSSGRLFYPVNLKAEEAEEFLLECDTFISCGIVCRVPDFWKRRGRRTSVTVTVGNRRKLDLMTVLSIKPSLFYEGVEVTRDDIEKLLAETSGIAFLKGKWVVLDKDKLKKLLDASSMLSSEMTAEDLMSFTSGLRKAPVELTLPDENWLGRIIKESTEDLALPEGLKASLRPYQVDGYKYLTGMRDAGFGICLADDMGLGKTVQVLSFLEKLREDGKAGRVLLVVPATLLGNWQNEIMKFTPSLDYHVFHGSGRALASSFLTITTYGVVAKDEALIDTEWDAVVLDEAQYIKNAGTKAARRLGQMRRKTGIALTGTPVENNLMNLWSIMEFVNPGFLGTKTGFARYAKGVGIDQLSRLRNAVAPFILRRLKSDRSIINDLPGKVETELTVTLSKPQIVLYRKVVRDTERAVMDAEDDFATKGLVLSSIMKLKQICNHPDQYLGQEGYKISESGKFEMLRELCSTIHENREKVLVFTQFKEIIPALDNLLAGVFCMRGLTIDGSVSAKRRTGIVREFQEGRAPYMVLSLKAAGTGLNLTAARNVIHFDRWWNPAVENQATDRAYRIGQKEKVMVYKFVSRDTVEEEISRIMQSKQELADTLFSDLSSDIFSKLSSKEILSAMRFRGGD